MATRSSPAVQPLSLDWLLHPVAESDFFQTSWERKPVLVERTNSEYFAGLPGLDSIEELITATSAGRIRSKEDAYLVRSEHGTPRERGIRLDAKGIPDIQDVYGAYHDGFTVVVNRIHCRSAVVADLSRNLESALHHPVGVNLYFTPKRGQGLPPHVDTHDVFILQLHGTKEWHVGSPPKDLPLADAENNPVELRDFQEFTLRPGDTFYLPRGFPHEALTSTSSSLHLTVGINSYRWVDLIAEALDALADEDLRLRRTLPPGFLHDPLKPEHASELAERLADALKNGALAELAKVRLGTRLFRGTKAMGAGNFRSLDEISGLTEASQVYRTPSLFCRVRSTSDEALIEFPTNFVSGPKFLEPALRFIAGRERFAVHELPDTLSGEDKLDLVGRLVREGLLQINQEI
ncbi:cupin domain-containing protein [Streptomyces sp. NPDC059168]|uniref:cupin domain-containing protein n=1 Tax=Streptomyces sp. NPDC059168 TaxID=3346753 RepID=UPI0036A473EC